MSSIFSPALALLRSPPPLSDPRSSLQTQFNLRMRHACAGLRIKVTLLLNFITRSGCGRDGYEYALYVLRQEYLQEAQRDRPQAIASQRQISHDT